MKTKLEEKRNKGRGRGEEKKGEDNEGEDKIRKYENQWQNNVLKLLANVVSNIHG